MAERVPNDEQEEAGPVVPDDDPDALELIAAEKALSDAGESIGDDSEPAEGGASVSAVPENQDDVQIDPKDVQPGSDATPKPDPAPADDGKAAASENAGQPRMVPHARFHEVNSKLHDTELENARLQGENDALRRTSSAPDSGAPDTQNQSEPKPEDEIVKIRLEKQAVSARFDDGQIGLAEANKELEALGDREQAIRDTVLENRLAEKAPPANRDSLSDQFVFRNQATELNETHPYLGAITDADAVVLTDMAYAVADREGVRLGNDNESTFWLRSKVADLSDTFGPKWYPEFKPEPKAPDKPNSQPPQRADEPNAGGAPKRSPLAQARAEKLEQAESHPPDTGNLGTGGESEGITEDDINRMSDLELENLDPRTVARFSG